MDSESRKSLIDNIININSESVMQNPELFVETGRQALYDQTVRKIKLEKETVEISSLSSRNL